MAKNLITGYETGEGESHSSPVFNEYIINNNNNVGNNIALQDINELTWDFE